MMQTPRARVVILAAAFCAALPALLLAAPLPPQHSPQGAGSLSRGDSNAVPPDCEFFAAPPGVHPEVTAGAVATLSGQPIWTDPERLELRSPAPLFGANGGDSPDASGGNWFSRGVKRGLRDQREIYSAPFHRSAVKWDLTFLAGTGALIAADKHISGSISRDDLDVSRNISNVGLYGTAAALGVLWTSSFSIQDEQAREHAREAGYLGLEAFANTFAVYSLIQVATGRERPLEGRGTGRFEQHNTLGSSFPSGHSAFTWSLAAVLAHEYPKPWVEWLAYGTAASVSITRVTGLKHFSADVAVGAVFGYLIGRYVFHAHCRPSLSPACPAKEPASIGD